MLDVLFIFIMAGLVVGLFALFVSDYSFHNLYNNIKYTIIVEPIFSADVLRQDRKTSKKNNRKHIKNIKAKIYQYNINGQNSYGFSIDYFADIPYSRFSQEERKELVRNVEENILPYFKKRNFKVENIDKDRWKINW